MRFMPILFMTLNSRQCHYYIVDYKWRCEISRKPEVGTGSGNKVETYSEFKNDFKYEKYLDFHTNFKERRLISKLRMSAHRLEVETGRYQSKPLKVKREDRVCRMCDLDILEDEKHVVMICPKYACQRKIMISCINEAFVGFEAKNIHDQFRFIMQCTDWEVFRVFSDMLVHISTLRGSL
jgi:hypothetical protein